MHKKIDILNIGLILVSLLIAIIIPFKLFLFSYAVLGPLHYLTEINWLKEKNFFVKPRSIWIWFFVIITTTLALFPLYTIIEFSIDNSFYEGLLYVAKRQELLILTAFLFSIGLILFKNLWHLLLSLVVSFLISCFLYLFVPKWIFLLGLFLPTIFHVYLFTGLFMLYGSIKSKSKYGYWGVGLLLLVPFIIAFLTISSENYIVAKETATIYNVSGFLKINSVMNEVFGGLIDGRFRVLSPLSIKIQIFIAFAYTYHYLNWFSKTSVIGWKKSLTTKKAIFIGVIWAASVAIYTYDFYTGLIALYFLSMLHVFFEFPLNVITIKELFKWRKSAVHS